MAQLKYIEEILGEDPQLVIVWLHGLGADGFDFQPIPRQLTLPDNFSAHFIFPHAPVQAVTLNQGMHMPAWFDIYELSLHAKEDDAGIVASMHSIESLIEQKFGPAPTQKIILAGFSQGGAIALHTLLHGRIDLAGVIALSTYLPLRSQASRANLQRLQKIPVFMAHGMYDDVLPCEIGELAKNTLTELQAAVVWHTYPMPHSLCNEQILDIRNWLLQHFSNQAS